MQTFESERRSLTLIFCTRIFIWNTFNPKKGEQNISALWWERQGKTQHSRFHEMPTSFRTKQEVLIEIVFIFSSLFVRSTSLFISRLPRTNTDDWYSSDLTKLQLKRGRDGEKFRCHNNIVYKILPAGLKTSLIETHKFLRRSRRSDTFSTWTSVSSDRLKKDQNISTAERAGDSSDI